MVFRSLNDVWTYADEHNITVRTARYDIEKSQYATKGAIGNFLPQLGLNGTATENTALQTTLIPGQLFGGKDNSYKAVQFGQKYIYNGGFTAQMDIVNVQTWMSMKIARESEALSRDSMTNQKKTVYQQIATQYYSFLLMKVAADLAHTSERIADSVLQSVQSKFADGLANAANVDVAKMNLMRAKQTSITSEYQMATSKNTLKGLLDIAPKDSLEIADDLNHAEAVSDVGIFALDPSVTIAERQVNLGMLQYKNTLSTFWPTLSVSYNDATQQNDNKFEPFSTGGPFWYPARYWTLHASWMLFNGGSRYWTAKRSKVAWEEKKLLADNVRKQADINDENLRLAYKKAAALAANSKTVMELSLDNYRHTCYRYKEGMATMEDRLNAFSDFINYQNQYLNNISDLLVQTYLVKIRQTEFK